MSRTRAPSARYLALGDSYTIGEGVANSDRWPVQLAMALRRASRPVSDPIVVARTGWTAGELRASLDGNPPTGTYELVTLLIGVNDQYRGYPIDRYLADLRELLRRSVAWANGKASHVVVVSTPDWGVTPFASGRDAARIQAEIDAFNAAERAEATQVGAKYVDITEISRRDKGDATAFTSDGLHPSATAYARWVGKIEPVAADILVPQ